MRVYIQKLVFWFHLNCTLRIREEKRIAKQLLFASLIPISYTKHLQTGRSKRSYRQVCVSRLISCVCDRSSASCSEGQSDSELPIFEEKIMQSRNYFIFRCTRNRSGIFFLILSVHVNFSLNKIYRTKTE